MDKGYKQLKDDVYTQLKQSDFQIVCDSSYQRNRATHSFVERRLV